MSSIAPFTSEPAQRSAGHGPPGRPHDMTASFVADADATSTLDCFLVEDSALIRENLVSTLQEMVNLRLLGEAEDEDSALRWLQSGPPPCDLLIIDIFLKRGTGMALLPRARALQPQAKLVVLSNYATPEMRRRCLELGADRVFDKSGELDELIAYCLDLA